ncbi:MAG: response regulator [Myxococcales bacterium]|nr:response regulator [Myxococcales bacterium]
MMPASSAAPAAEILVVDDDPEVRDAICDVLEDEGFRVQRAANGQEALTRLALELPSAIVLDLTMPVMDGHAFLQARARDPRLRRIPVIVVTASMSPEISNDVQLVRKPIDVDALVEAVRAHTRP